MSAETLSTEGLLCIIQFFTRTNESEGLLIGKDADKDGIMVKVDPSKLSGIDVIWRIVKEANDSEVVAKAIDFLNELYMRSNGESSKAMNSFIRACSSQIEETAEDPVAMDKGALTKLIKLMDNMISKSEAKGTGNLRPCNSLLKGPILCITLKNNLKFPKDSPDKLEFEMYGNVTIWDFKLELAKYLKVSPECMQLSINLRNVEDTDNGKLVSCFVEMNPCVVSVGCKNCAEVCKAPLLSDDQSLTAAAKAVFADIFSKFAVNEKLSKEGIVNFIKGTTEVSELSVNDERVQYVLSNFDQDGDNCLSLNEFLEFYRSALSEGNEESVREDLAIHGYRSDLQRIDKVPLQPASVDALPRHVLAHDSKSFELLFDVLDRWGQAAECVWELLCKLTVNDGTFRKIEDVEKIESWEEVIDTRSTFRLLYTLIVVRAFAEDEKAAQWRDEFIKKGGFSFLTDLLTNQNAKMKFALETMGKFENKALKYIECILRIFIDSAACVLNEDFVSARIEYAKIFSGEAKEPIKNSIFNTNPSAMFFPKYYYAKQDIVPTVVATEEQAKIVFNDIKAKELWKRQLDILCELLISMPKPEIDLIGPSVVLFCSCACCDASFFSAIKSYSHSKSTFEDMLLFGLLRFNSSFVRGIFVGKFRFLCFLYKDSPKASKLLTYILQLLIHSIPKENTDPVKCGEFFQLLCQLIDIYYKEKEGMEEKDKIFDSVELVGKVVSALKGYFFSEGHYMEMLLIGFIATIKRILNHEPSLKTAVALEEGLLEELFANCLFPPRSDFAKQKCKTSKTRMAAYKLLLSLCHNNALVLSELISKYLTPLLNSLRVHGSWGYNPVEQGRSKLGYVGIKNLGCICYMNSILQQFYMIPTFRYGILSAEGSTEDILYNLRKLFTFLEVSERQAYDPREFCAAFKDLEGNPTDVRVQQDAHEFLNVAFERMESCLAKTPQRFLVRSVFGGKTCSQITCSNCNTVKRNLEDFYNLSVEVKGLNSLFESLSKFVSADTIADYYCETCKQKVNVAKQTTLYELPNVLIIHLQRIVFNFDALINIKINSRLEFPRDFSVEQYTLEGVERPEEKRDPSKYQYKLAGVVANIGFANAGHYYSFINTNRKRKKTFNVVGDKGEKDCWLEFNDSVIAPFE